MLLKHFSGFQVTHQRSCTYAPDDLEEGLKGVNLLATINITDNGQNEKKIANNSQGNINREPTWPILLGCLCLEIMRHVLFFGNMAIAFFFQLRKCHPFVGSISPEVICFSFFSRGSAGSFLEQRIVIECFSCAAVFTACSDCCACTVAFTLFSIKHHRSHHKGVYSD